MVRISSKSPKEHSASSVLDERKKEGKEGGILETKTAGMSVVDAMDRFSSAIFRIYQAAVTA